MYTSSRLRIPNFSDLAGGGGEMGEEREGVDGRGERGEGRWERGGGGGTV
jgi:hypothetical protein